MSDHDKRGGCMDRCYGGIVGELYRVVCIDRSKTKLEIELL